MAGDSVEPTRAIRWVSSQDPRNAGVLAELQARMAAFYSNNATYYEEIAYTADGWHNESSYQTIARRVAGAGGILEVGCGRANILLAYPELAPAYTGVDFSADLMAHNTQRFPSARFVVLTDAARLPLPDRTFDRMFSTFVLEHCVYPQSFLRECLRVLRPGGELLLLCPKFLDCDAVVSQRAGLAHGDGRDKLSAGRWWDAVLTAYDRRIRIPRAARRAKKAADRGEGGFWINLAPTCFVDPFYPDADAVYLTYEREIVRELERHGAQVESIGRYADRIFLSARLP